MIVATYDGTTKKTYKLFNKQRKEAIFLSNAFEKEEKKYLALRKGKKETTEPRKMQ